MGNTIEVAGDNHGHLVSVSKVFLKIVMNQKLPQLVITKIISSTIICIR